MILNMLPFSVDVERCPEELATSILDLTQRWGYRGGDDKIGAGYYLIPEDMKEEIKYYIERNTTARTYANLHQKLPGKGIHLLCLAALNGTASEYLTGGWFDITALNERMPEGQLIMALFCQEEAPRFVPNW